MVLSISKLAPVYQMEYDYAVEPIDPQFYPNIYWKKLAHRAYIGMRDRSHHEFNFEIMHAMESAGFYEFYHDYYGVAGLKKAKLSPSFHVAPTVRELLFTGTTLLS